MIILRQSTARTILVGPILDASGVAKTDDVVGSIKITKNGTVGAANGSATLTHDHAGKYLLALTASDTDTLGIMQVSLNSGTNDMPVRDCMVLTATAFDTLVTNGTLASTTSGRTIAVDASGNLVLQDGSLTAAKIATDAITAAKIASDAVTEIQSGLSTLDAAAVRTAVGMAAANMDTQLAALAAYVDTLETTLNALSTKFGGITLLKNWLALIMGKTADTTTRAEVNATTAGATYNETTDSLESQKDNSTGALTSEQDATLTAIATAVSGGAVEISGRVSTGGTVTAYIGDDFKVRSDTELSISVTDVGGTLYTKWSAIGEENLYFGASREGADVGAITGTVASITSVGSGASQTCKLTVEITNCGSGLKPGTYEYQIEQRQTQGSDTDSFIEVSGSLILKRNSVA